MESLPRHKPTKLQEWIQTSGLGFATRLKDSTYHFSDVTFRTYYPLMELFAYVSMYITILPLKINDCDW